MQEMTAVGSEILQKAKNWGAELIIVGSKTSPSPHITDYSGAGLRVARDAHCSVRIARTSDRKSNSAIQIIIAVDESNSAASVINAVADRIWPAGTEANIFVVSKGGPRDPKRDSATTPELNRFADKLRAMGLQVSLVTKVGEPQNVLLQEARELLADCIFVDSHAWSHGPSVDVAHRGLGKVAEALVLGASCSVEVVRSKTLTDHQYLKPAV